MKKVLLVLSVFMVLMVAGCLGPKRAENFQPMEVSFEWRGNAGSYESSPNPESMWEIFLQVQPFSMFMFEI